MTQEIKFATDLFKMVISGKKTNTVRKGLREYSLGTVLFVTDPPNKHGMVKTAKGFITKIELSRLKHLTDHEAGLAGYKCLGDYVRRLKEIYPDIGLDSEITKVEFRLGRCKVNEAVD